MRIARLVLVLALALARCSAETQPLGPTPEPAGDVPHGWRLHDSAPYPRIGHTAIFDEEGDRMVVFGGGANDVWVLPLSGPDANRWMQLETAGPQPPVHSYGSSMMADTAIFDPVKRRMIVVQNPWPSTASPVYEVTIWQLTLSGTPTWSEFIGSGPSPENEIQSGRAVYDPRGRRMIILGGARDTAGVWALSLDDAPAWSRVADVPAQRSAFYAEHSLVLDAAEDRVILFGGHPRLRSLWSLSLDTNRWTELDEGNNASAAYGVTTLFDEASRSILIAGGDQSPAVYVFALDTGTWTRADAARVIGAAAVVDRARNRAVFFGGSDGGAHVGNETLALALDTMTWSTLVPATKILDSLIGERQLVFDPTRAKVVAFGGHSTGATSEHGLDVDDAWTEIDAGETPLLSLSPGIYDPIERAIVAFGAHSQVLPTKVWTLSSDAGAAWKEQPASGVPPLGRWYPVTVYDGDRRRLLTYGGWRIAGPSGTTLGDLWELSLDGSFAWKEITPPDAGAGPVPRFDAAGAYDTDRRRLIVIGGTDGNDKLATDVWALPFDEDPAKWRPIPMRGAIPADLEHPSAIYDPIGRRVIVSDQPSTGLRVHSLQVTDGEARWDRFCWTSITPAPTYGFPGTSGAPVRVPEGLYFTTSGGAFIFDLDTAFCD